MSKEKQKDMLVFYTGLFLLCPSILIFIRFKSFNDYISLLFLYGPILIGYILSLLFKDLKETFLKTAILIFSILSFVFMIKSIDATGYILPGLGEGIIGIALYFICKVCCLFLFFRIAKEKWLLYTFVTFILYSIIICALSVFII